ncbi:neprilysin-like [Hetaerina americana]|uniref:neprilysin-like n=1 Tax=Hetaerina americana TaxID=62018 RepID=UPI003A7F5E3F
MQRGSYDLLQSSQANGIKVQGEASPLLEMTEPSTCTLKEIIEGETVEDGGKAEAEGKASAEDSGDGGGNLGAAAASPEAIPEVNSVDSQEDDDSEQEGESEVKANGGEELGKAGEVRVAVGSPTRGSEARRSFWQRCSFTNKCLISIVIILALCILFMALAWPRKSKAEPATNVPGQAESQSGVDMVITPTTASPSLPSSPAATTDRSGSSPLPTEVDNEATTESVSEENPTVGEEGERSTTDPGDVEVLMRNNNEELEQLQQKSSKNEKDQPVCSSSTCYSLATNMLAFMNDTTDPCKDFYTYACGGMTAEGSQWMAEPNSELEIWSRISDGMKSANESSPTGKKIFKNFYESCVTYEKDVSMEDRIIKARRILTDVGQFYKTKDWVDNHDSKHLTQLLGNLLIHHYAPFLDLLLDVDSSNSARFALKLTLPLMQSPFRDSTGSDSWAKLNGWTKEVCKRRATAETMKGLTGTIDSRYEDMCNVDFRVKMYVKEMKTALKYLNISTDDEWQDLFPSIEDKLKIIMEIMPTKDEETRIIAEKDFRKYKLHELLQNDSFSIFDWKSLIEQLGIATKSDVPMDTEVQVYFESYIMKLFEEISTDDTRKWNNILMAMFAHELYYGLVHPSPCNRETYCLTVTGRLLEDVASTIFLESFSLETLSTFQKKIKSTFSDIIGTLESEISTKLEKESNFTNTPKNKIQEIGLVADGGVPIFLHHTYLDKKYDYEEAATYLENAVSLLKMYRIKMYQSFNKNPSDPEQIWHHFIDPYSNEGLAIVGLNKIVVPYGMLQRPFFSEYYPPYVQMARLGQMIAKEIWKLIRETGIQQHIPGMFKKGLLQSMPRSSRMFNISENMLLFEKNSSRQAQIREEKGNMYLNNLLPDTVAAYLAYRSIWKDNTKENNTKLPYLDMSPKQLYFLAMGQNSCTKFSKPDHTLTMLEDLRLPPAIRINDITMNSHEFREAFHCPPGNQS